MQVIQYKESALRSLDNQKLLIQEKEELMRKLSRAIQTSEAANKEYQHKLQEMESNFSSSLELEIARRLETLKMDFDSKYNSALDELKQTHDAQLAQCLRSNEANHRKDLELNQQRAGQLQSQIASLNQKLAEKDEILLQQRKESDVMCTKKIQEALELQSRSMSSAHASVLMKLQDSVNVLVKENALLSQETEVAKQKMSEADRKSQLATIALSKAEESIAAKHRELERSLADIKHQKERHEREFEALIHSRTLEEVARLKSSLEAAKSKQIEFVVEKLLSEKASLETAHIAQVEQIIQSSEETKEALQQEVSLLEAQLTSTRKELEQTRQSAASTQAVLETKHKQLKTDILERLQAELSLKSEVVAAQEERVLSLTARVKDLESRLHLSQQENRQMRDRIASLEKLAAETKRDAENSVREIEDRVRDVVARKNTTIDTLKHENKTLAERIERLGQIMGRELAETND